MLMIHILNRGVNGGSLSAATLSYSLKMGFLILSIQAKALCKVNQPSLDASQSSNALRKTSQRASFLLCKMQHQSQVNTFAQP